MVDDEPDVNLIFKATLEGSGYFQVDVFNDAASALSMFIRLGAFRYQNARNEWVPAI